LLCLSPLQAIGAERLTGQRPDPTTDEGGLWTESDKAERAVKNSAEIDTDPELTAYVRKVACDVSPEHCGEIRVYVLDRPFFNAAAAPNGYIEVWSGTLLRARNEAELAFVLSHEISHFDQNHSIKAWRAAKTRANTAMAVSIVAGIALSAATFNPNTGVSSFDNYAASFVDIVYLGAMASMFSFSRDQESDADRLGLERLTKAGYAPSAAVDIWRSRMDETQSSDFEKVRKSQARTSIFDSHPVEKDRLAALSDKLPADAKGELRQDALRKIVRPHLAVWLKDDLRRRDFGQTLFLISRLAEGGEDLGLLNFYRGEAYRLRHAEGDLAKAKEAYLAAAALPDCPVSAWRELGDLRRRDNDPAGAKAAYESYLAKAPEAEDAWLVKDTLKTLK
jgi:predicted Zn-dependent protease